MSGEERRSHGRSPWREAYEMLALRPSRATTDTIELGQSAAGVSYVKSLQVTRDEGEAWGVWLRRATDMLGYAVERLPAAPVSPPKPEKEEGKASGQVVRAIVSERRRKAPA